MRLLIIFLGLTVADLAQAQIYRCEDSNGVIEYSNKPTGSKDRNCKSVELPTVTTIPAPKLPPPKAGAAGNTGGAAAGAANSGANSSANANGRGASREGGARVEESTQRSRDGDRKRILEDELKKEEGKLADLRKEFANGEPERQGDERNYQKYLDRVQRMKDEIGRTEGNIDSLKKELGSAR